MLGRPPPEGTRAGLARPRSACRSGRSAASRCCRWGHTPPTPLPEGERVPAADLTALSLSQSTFAGWRGVALRRAHPRPPCLPFRAWAVPASVPAVIGLRSSRTGLALYCSCWRRRTAPGRHHAAPPPPLVFDLLVAVGRTPPPPCCFFLSLLAPAKQIPLFPLPCAPRP